MPDYNPSNCTLQTCPITNSYNPYQYQPSLVANTFFITFFSLATLIYVFQFFLFRGGWAFTVAMLSGGALEIIGYAGRIINHYNPWDHNGYLLQIICLTLAPVFFAAGIYVTLNLVVSTIAPHSSRLTPRLYPRIFIACDIVSLLLQACGGGIAAAAVNDVPPKDPSVGNHIIVAGIAFQVVTMLVFICLAVDFGLRVARQERADGGFGAVGPKYARIRRSTYFKGFVVALGLATICIFARCVFRCAELGVGWEGYIIHDQKLFIALEGAMIAVAVGALCAFHPFGCFGKKFQRQDERQEEKDEDGSGQ